MKLVLQTEKLGALYLDETEICTSASTFLTQNPKNKNKNTLKKYIIF